MSAGGLLLAAFAAIGFAQSSPGPTGSLSGKLTDLYSHPLDGAALVLRNDSTGAVVRTITARNGSYHFSALAPGEYTLQAESARSGQGQLAGIFVAAGHEAHVQAALELTRPPQTLALAALSSTHPAPVPLPPLPSPTVLRPDVASVALDSSLSFQPIETLPVAGKGPSPHRAPDKVSVDPPQPGPASSARPAPPEPGKLALASPPVLKAAEPAPAPHAAIVALHPGLDSASGLAVARACAALAAAQLGQASPVQVLAAQTSAPETEIAASSAITGEQLESLPAQGRHWENFVLDTPEAAASRSDDSTESPRGSGRAAPAVTVDGATTRLAFGGHASGRMRSSSLMGPGSSEEAISEVRTFDDRGPSAEGSTDERASVETRHPSQGLHGQGFFFDRQNLWNAQNPFTQWVKETAPATSLTSPAFTAFPYTAPDSEDRWGLGIGSRIRRNRLFWFAAYDGSRRRDPGVSTVKHPDNFFAQPTNDEMQVLSSRLGLSSVNPVVEGLAAYSGMLEQLSGLLGPAPRTATQWVGFGRLDWNAAERHHFTLEGTGARWNSPGGGFTRTAEPYGNHSFGASRASEAWLLGRWEAFLTPNLLAVTQGSVGRHIFAEGPEPPSPLEQNLNVNAWGQLPQMVVDSRYGFTIGNPARFGSGSYPDEHLYQFQETVNWVHGGLLVKAGGDWRHNADVTGMVRNHTGTYYYSTVENFISDVLSFSKYGLSGTLDPTHQHNCDPHGRAWRDSTGQLNGLGYLPCYSSYSQVMGPTDWHLSTNDVAGFATAQWQPARRLVMSAGVRWEREYFPPPIALADNPDLPLTRAIPTPGNQWAPRLSLAWGSGESRLPVLRAGYGMFFGRTQNSVLETALTQTGSLKGDLNFFMRPTDNLASGGAPPFPYVFAGEPATMVKPGAVELSPQFRNPEIHQAEVTVEEHLPGHVQVEARAMMSLARRLPINIDTNIDPSSNPGTITYAVVDALNAGPIKAERVTVPFYASWPAFGSTPASTGRVNSGYQQITEVMARANSTYEAAMLRVSRDSRRGLTFRVRYIYSHAMDWNPNETSQISGSSVLDPADFRQEYGTSDLDVRHSASAMFLWTAPWKLKHLEGKLANGWMLSGIGQYHSGLPYTMRTAGSIPEEFETSGAAIVGLGGGMNGSGGDNRVYGVGRNTYRYPFTWKADARIARRFNLGQMRQLELLAESFNLFNRQNVTQLETVGYYISSGSSASSLPTLNFLTGLKTGQTEFGKPLDINATDFFRPRQFDFGMRMRF